MKTLLWPISILVILTLLVAGCSPFLSHADSSRISTRTPFQPLPPTITLTASSTPIFTSTPTITLTPLFTLTPEFTETPSVRTIEAGAVEVPILLYHHINPDIKNSPYSIDPVGFEAQMKWLKENHYQTITVTELANLIRNGGTIPVRPVVITFDDGYTDVYTNAFPILKNYGYIATFYIIGGTIDKPANITTDQLKELITNGWEIGSHSQSHAHLNEPSADLAIEINYSKGYIEEKVQITVNSFAYPYGQITDDIVAITKAAGYSSAVGLVGKYSQSMSNIYYLSRIEVDGDFTLEDFKNKMPCYGPLD